MSLKHIKHKNIVIQIIKFQGFKYPIREISFPFGIRTIGVEKLNDVLMNENGGYVSEEARIIDEHIFYFVAKKNFYLTAKKLSLNIIAQL